MNYYIATDYYGNYDLAHHGIKGQKWGVRRYQNEDGSLTSAGRERYNESVRSLNRLDRDIAKAKYQRAKNTVKLAKAQMKGKKEKVEKRKSLDKELGKAISSGEKTSKDILNKLEKSGFQISQKNKTRYVKAGNSVAAWLFLPGVGPLAYAGVQGIKGHRHGSQYVGFIDGTKYGLEGYNEKKK